MPADRPPLSETSPSDTPTRLLLEHYWPRLKKERFGEADFRLFEIRLQRYLPDLLDLLLQLYGARWDFLYHAERLIELCAGSWAARSEELRELDAARERSPEWFEAESQVGAVFYVDLFCGTLEKVREHLPYLRELGITYLHLMPFFAVPPGNSDGGYAVSSYRHVRPDLGTMEDLAKLAAELRHMGISLVADFVFNHTADDHTWAQAAKSGDPEKLGYYHTFPDRTLPDRYEETLREIFPTIRRGSFTFDPALQRWVWTTFHSFQWDLNYGNPAVFNAMAGELLFLANQGVEVLRLDAVAFIWKRLGTSCENQPEAHLLVRAYNLVARIAAPALLFKSEAIVHPDEVLSYIDPGECQLSYNPLLMALCWEALATREVRLLGDALKHRHALPRGTAWVNYLRSHDDIGWTFDDQDARRLGIDPHGHRRFLNDFYTGRFPGSFARGLPFQENPETGDARVSGTLASLAGLESALEKLDSGISAESADAEIGLAVRRILLLYSVVLTAGGVPLIYLGDEMAQLNDYTFAQDPEKHEDSRWVHRPNFPWNGFNAADSWGKVSRRLREELLRLIRIRKTLPALRGNRLEVVETGNAHVLGYFRRISAQDAGLPEAKIGPEAKKRCLFLGNFSEAEQWLGLGDRYDLHKHAWDDQIGGGRLTFEMPVSLAPYQILWLVPAPAEG